MRMKVLPEKILRLMSPEDRKSIGQMTTEETFLKTQARNERELQGQIVNLLRLKDVEVLWHRTDRRSHATKGWPDITFCTRHGGHAWEIKFEGGALSQEQERMIARMQKEPNGWDVRVIKGLPEAIKAMAELGLWK